MTPIFSSLLDSITIESFLAWASRATIIAAIACAFLALARRARPATRHMVAIASLIAVAVLPIASALLPTLSLPVLPAPAQPAVVATPPASRAVPFAIDAPTPAPAPAAVPTPAAPAAIVVPARPAQRESGATIGSIFRETVRTTIRSMDLGTVVLLSWFTVTATLLLWTLMGAIGARRLSRRTLAVDNDMFTIESKRACRVLGLTRTVDVGVSPDVEIPMVVGALNPRIVVPASAAAWPPERLRVVLLHELAHVRRNDVRWMLVARVVTSVFWFHPLVWVLSQHARRDAERACDEIVLSNGVRGSDYAEHLVAIARTAMTRDPMADSALAFASRSTLEQRVVAILATRVTCTSASRRARIGALTASLVLLAAIATVRPTRVDSAQMLPMESSSSIEAAMAPIDEAAPSIDAIAPEPAFPIDYVFAEETTQEHFTEQKYYLANDDDRSGHEWYARANDYYNDQRYKQAAEAYSQAAKRGYRRGTALYNAGCSYALANQEGKAIDVLREAFDEGFDRPDLFAEDDDLNSLRADPRFKELMDDVMSSGTAQAAKRAATRDFERLAKASAVDEGDWNSVGIDLLRSGDYEGAAKAFDNEFAVSKDEDAVYNKACARSLAGKTDEALKLLEQSITTGSVDADHLEKDPDLVALHDDARFDNLVTLAEDLTLHTGGWWNGKGDWSWKGNDEKRWRKSIPRFEEITRKYPKVGRAWFNLGYAQLEGEEARSSTPSFQKALDLGYRPSTTMYNLACAEAQSGNVDASIAWLEKAEGAGMKMWHHARWDDDLDPIRNDSRYKAMAKRWKAEERAHDKHHDKDHDWDWNDDDDT